MTDEIPRGTTGASCGCSTDAPNAMCGETAPPRRRVLPFVAVMLAAIGVAIYSQVDASISPVDPAPVPAAEVPGCGGGQPSPCGGEKPAGAACGSASPSCCGGQG